MRVMRELPIDLAAQLYRARRIERIALYNGGRRSQRMAIRGTDALILAAHEAGWTVAEIAAGLRMKRQAVSNQVRAARTIYGGARPALIIDAPLSTLLPRRAVLELPLEQRGLLSRREAATFLSTTDMTLRSWRHAGLLPNTNTSGEPHLYFRGDLERLRSAPRRGWRQVYLDIAALRARIAGSRI